MARSLDEVRRKTASAWEMLAKIPGKVAAGWQSAKVGGQKMGIAAAGVGGGLYDKLQDLRAYTTGNPRHATRYRTAARAIQGLQHPGLQRIGAEERDPLGLKPGTDPEGERAMSRRMERAAQPHGIQADPQKSQLPLHERKHHESLRKDTQELIRHSRQERRNDEDKESGEGGEGMKGGKLAGLVAATFTLGRILQEKMSGDRGEREKFEEGLDKFSAVNGRIMSAMVGLEVSRFRERIATARVIEDVASARLQAQRQYEEDTAEGRAQWERIKQEMGGVFDELKHAFGRAFFGALGKSDSDDKRLKTDITWADRRGFLLLDHIRQGKFPMAAQGPAVGPNLGALIGGIGIGAAGAAAGGGH
jgi:hypothetical protein